MTTTTKTVELVMLQAAEDKVLCNGYTKTSVGGSVTVGAGSDVTAWVEMPEAEADALIEANAPSDNGALSAAEV
jgi:hypothetical protein